MREIKEKSNNNKSLKNKKKTEECLCVFINERLEYLK